MTSLSSSSEAITDGVRVRVQSQYLADQSSPAHARYVWAYTITIRNESEIVCQLRRRHWIITDANGYVDEVKGPGVVGQEPHLECGQQFQYTSGCVLKTATGSMRGTYTMERTADNNTDTKFFDVEIAQFRLGLPANLN